MNSSTVEINGKEVLMIEWCEDTCSIQYHVFVQMALPSGKSLDMELSLPSSFHPPPTESTDSVSLGSPPTRNNLTFTVEAQLEHCEEPDRCTSQQMVGSLDLAAEPPSFLFNWNVLCAVTNICNIFGLSYSDVLKINLDMDDPCASFSYTWRYSPHGPQYRLEMKDGHFDINL